LSYFLLTYISFPQIIDIARLQDTSRWWELASICWAIPANSGRTFGYHVPDLSWSW